jgi:hypothetical protein
MVIMDYKLVRTINGPAVMGEDEVVYLSQHQLLLDYYDADPEFVTKVKTFIQSELVDLSTNLGNSLFVPVVGGDLAQPLFGYISAINNLRQFEYQFLPSVFPELRK